MLREEQVETVKKLLAHPGATFRQVARLSGVSRGAVTKISLGHWRKKRRGRDPLGIPAFDKTLTVRCEICGCKVFPPCLKCSPIEDAKILPLSKERFRFSALTPLQLSGEKLDRYNELHEKKLREGDDSVSIEADFPD